MTTDRDFSGLTTAGTLKVGDGSKNPYSEYGLLAFIGAIVDNFKSLGEVVQQYNLNSATLFTPQILNLLDSEITRNPGVIHDAYLIMDLVNIYSIETTGNTEGVRTRLIESITLTRFTPNSGTILSEESLDHYVIDDAESFVSILQNNTILIALYLFILVKTLF